MDKEKKENVVKKEDDRYYSGSFWIIADSIESIRLNKFEIVGEKIKVDYYANRIKGEKFPMQDKKLWKEPEYSKWNNDYEYDYFPRGSITPCEGIAFIYIHREMNMPNVIDAIIKEYELENLSVEVHCLEEGEEGSILDDFKLK